MRSQLSVLMFADLVGYSALMEADQEQALTIIMGLRNLHFEPLVEKHGGEILKRLGDGWIVSFGSVLSCIAAAREVQVQLDTLGHAKLRIGCHIGEVIRDDADIYGSGINIAQRIQAESPPGGIMVSEDFFRQLSGPDAESVNDAGVFRLKNIAQPVRLYQWRPKVQRGGDPGDATSIAIAKVEFAPADPETAALAGDLRDQLLIRLSRRFGLVIYDVAERPVDHATYDLRSRLRVAAGRGRLSLTLILREDGRPVWSENYERGTEDIFDFCDNVLERAEADLRLQTNAFDGDRLANIPDDDLSVSELRARAANCFYRVTYDDWQHGLGLMDRAIQMNPADGVALAMRGEAAIMLFAARYEPMPQTEVDRLERDLDIAVEQSPGSDYVFWSRGTFRVNCLGDTTGARADLQRSRNLNPAYLEAYELEGHILMLESRFAEAAVCFGKLLERQTHNPLRPYRLFLRSVAHLAQGDVAAALEDARLACDVRPNERGLCILLALAQEAAGESEAAAQTRARASAMEIAPTICGRCPVLPPGFRSLAERLAAAVRADPEKQVP